MDRICRAWQKSLEGILEDGRILPGMKKNEASAGPGEFVRDGRNAIGAVVLLHPRIQALAYIVAMAVDSADRTVGQRGRPMFKVNLATVSKAQYLQAAVVAAAVTLVAWSVTPVAAANITQKIEYALQCASQSSSRVFNTQIRYTGQHTKRLSYIEGTYTIQYGWGGTTQGRVYGWVTKGGRGMWSLGWQETASNGRVPASCIAEGNGL